MKNPFEYRDRLFYMHLDIAWGGDDLVVFVSVAVGLSGRTHLGTIDCMDIKLVTPEQVIQLAEKYFKQIDQRRPRSKPTNTNSESG